MKTKLFKLCAPALIAASAFGLAACNDDDDDGAGGPAAIPPGPFEFRSEAAAMYVRIDRMGQPATGTALLSRAPGSAPADPTNVFNGFNNQRDAFNRDDPADDNANFLPAAAATLRVIHVELAPAVRALGLTTCSTGTGAATDISQCAAQVTVEDSGPTRTSVSISPDVMTLNPADPDGWPNGRRFDDNVINRLLSAALLDTRVHPITLLEGVPLNPRSNDANPAGTTLPQDLSPAAFPYIRPRHPAGV